MNNLGLNDMLSSEIYSYGNNASTFYTMQRGRTPADYSPSGTLGERGGCKRGTSNTATAKDEGAVLEVHKVYWIFDLPRLLLIGCQRRRAQNRAAQRAFRQRQESHVNSLQRRLEDLRKKHQDLLQSYTHKVDEVTKLNDRIEELNSEIVVVISSSAQSFNDFVTPHEFDAAPGSNMYYSGPECYFDEKALTKTLSLAFSVTEDTL
jgi:hypothetical protein